MNTSPPCRDTEAAVHTYGSMLWRISLALLGSAQDAEDAVQETFFSYAMKSPGFKTSEHEKAWLIRVLTNKCRDVQRAKKRRRASLSSGGEENTGSVPDTGVMEALARLPEKYRLVLMLHYAEGYSAKDIAPIIKRTPSAVKMRLQKGRKLLEDIYRREYL